MIVEVVIVGCIGFDQSWCGIFYIYVGFVWCDYFVGCWYFVYLLNYCGSNIFEFFDDGFVDFFFECFFCYDVFVVVLMLEFQ